MGDGQPGSQLLGGGSPAPYLTANQHTANGSGLSHQDAWGGRAQPILGANQLGGERWVVGISYQLRPRAVGTHFSLQISLSGNLSSALLSQDEWGSALMRGTFLFPGGVTFRGNFCVIP